MLGLTTEYTMSALSYLWVVTMPEPGNVAFIAHTVAIGMFRRLIHPAYRPNSAIPGAERQMQVN